MKNYFGKIDKNIILIIIKKSIKSLWFDAHVLKKKGKNVSRKRGKKLPCPDWWLFSILKEQKGY